MNDFFTKLQPFALNATRIMVGLTFWTHGADKLFTWFGRDEPVALMSRFGAAGLIETIADERLLEKMKSLNQAHQTDAALVYAGILASHLRFGLQTTYGRDIGKMREDNVPDYPWMCFALATLMKTYSRLHAEGITGTERDKIVEGIVNGLSPDAGAFLDDPPAFLAAYEAERSQFRDGLRRHREDLLEEFKQHQPSDKAYSPIALFFNFPHNLLKGAVH